MTWESFYAFESFMPLTPALQSLSFDLKSEARAAGRPSPITAAILTLFPFTLTCACIFATAVLCKVLCLIMPCRKFSGYCSFLDGILHVVTASSFFLKKETKP